MNRVKIVMTFEDNASGTKSIATIDSADGVGANIEGPVWPADLEMVRAVQECLKDRRHRYTKRKETTTR